MFGYPRYLAEPLRIFKTELIDRSDLLIPVDIVIKVVLNTLAQVELFKTNSNSVDDFNSINEFCKSRFGSKHMVFEDLWFWGYFGLSGPNGDREVVTNHDKIALDPFFNIQPAPVELFDRFGQMLL